jgi:hypothetical protein
MRVPAAVGVMVTEQLADAPVPERVQLADPEPAPLHVKLTVPVGVLTMLLGAVSVTVAVAVVAWLTTTVLGEAATVVVETHWQTLIVADPVLALWLLSPL